MDLLGLKKVKWEGTDTLKSGKLVLALNNFEFSLKAPLVSRGGIALMNRTYFLLATALVEVGIGLLLLVWPQVPIALLLGVEQASPEALATARIAGAALLALGVACSVGRNDHASAGVPGIWLGVLIYDLAAVGVLGCTWWFWKLSGIALWPAIALHAFMATWCLVCGRDLRKVKT